jgi:hypothetical protein
MGKPDWPTREQISELTAASQLRPAEEHRVKDSIELAPHELALVEWKP